MLIISHDAARELLGEFEHPREVPRQGEPINGGEEGEHVPTEPAPCRPGLA